jgi:hypothetical protein
MSRGISVARFMTSEPVGLRPWRWTFSLNHERVGGLVQAAPFEIEPQVPDHVHPESELRCLGIGPAQTRLVCKGHGADGPHQGDELGPEIGEGPFHLRRLDAKVREINEGIGDVLISRENTASSRLSSKVLSR